MTSSGVRVLFSGQYWPGANTLYIARAFERCGATVRFVNDSSIYPDWRTVAGRGVRRIITRVIEKEWNAALVRSIQHFNPDLIYVTNADLCWPETLETLRRTSSAPIMCFYHDVPWRNRPGSRFSQVLGEFDLVASTRAWHRDEFLAAGARDVMITRFGYEPTVHRPVAFTPGDAQAYGSSSVFVGSREHHRAGQLAELLSEPSGAPGLAIWGNGWGESAAPIREAWRGRDVYESELALVYSTSMVALHWICREPDSADEALRRGDQHNSRTFQIPACGGAILLAQRTAEHEALFEENREAIYFDSVPDLREKLAFWTASAQEAARREIAANALRRAREEDYSYKPVVARYLAHFGLPSA